MNADAETDLRVRCGAPDAVTVVSTSELDELRVALDDAYARDVLVAPPAVREIIRAASTLVGRVDLAGECRECDFTGVVTVVGSAPYYEFTCPQCGTFHERDDAE